MENGAHRTRRPLLLVIEPDFMVRRTIALVARDLDIADVHETSGSDAAASLLATAAYDGVLVCIDDRGYALIEQLRGGRTLCSARTPLAVTMSSCGVEDVQRLRDLGIDHVLLRPFKVKAVLQALQVLSRTRVDNAV